MVSTRQAGRALHKVRISGARWHIAMRDEDWRVFREDISVDAHARLRGAMDTFCRFGGDDLPEVLFRRIPGAGFNRHEVFAAHGVQLIGRRATDDSSNIFYVTEVRWISGGADVAPSRPRPVQEQLPLEITVKQKGRER